MNLFPVNGMGFFALNSLSPDCLYNFIYAIYNYSMTMRRGLS
jgi:hypothetical protein